MFTCTIDFSSCKNYNEMYDTIYQALEVPDWCGHNLDALWDVLRGFIDPPTEITITGIDTLKSSLKEELAEMLPVFDEAKELGITYKIE